MITTQNTTRIERFALIPFGVSADRSFVSLLCVFDVTYYAHPLAQLFRVPLEREKLDAPRHHRFTVDLVAGETDAVAETLQFLGQGTKGKDVSVGSHHEDADVHHRKVEFQKTVVAAAAVLGDRHCCSCRWRWR